MTQEQSMMLTRLLLLHNKIVDVKLNILQLSYIAADNTTIIAEEEKTLKMLEKRFNNITTALFDS